MAQVQVPVEIFEIITSYLSRAEVKKLRLVCREFEAKVSAQYFRNVVVPFRSELYSSLSRDENGTLKHSTASLFSNGMRIFESFGPHILRFALSLELDEDSLAYPPVKPTQEAVPAFWGIYRWPHEDYHRYTDLEGLEQTADETEGMKAALRCLSKVRDLGLCCDAGLGFLCGPDHVARNARVRHPVFATLDWRRHERLAQGTNRPIITVADFNESARDNQQSAFPHPMEFRRTILERMVTEAGYRGSQIDEAVRIVLQTEGTTLASIDFEERSTTIHPYAARLDENADGAPILSFGPIVETANFPLVPSNLTRAQKELLLELEWAHRAMIQSYVLGLVDNADSGCFNNVTTLTIAKIPASHIYLFYRDDVWEGIPSLKNVSIGIVADWRRVTAPTPGCVEDVLVSPVESVGKAFTLLNTYIGKRRNIESIHFEWICGGELAPSSYQRNLYILPAPFFHQPELIVSPTSVRDNSDALLKLPFVKHLSLKNCWSSPHVMLQTIRQLSMSSLEKLELESVSLSGPPTTLSQAPLLQAGLPQPGHGILPGLADEEFANQIIQELGQDIVQPLPPPPAVQVPAPSQAASPGAANGPTDSPLEIILQPDWLTWAGLIDHFSPSVKVRRLMAFERDYGYDSASPGLIEKLERIVDFIPRAAELYADQKAYKLKCLAFRSCGYVSVDVPFLDTRAVLPDRRRPRTSNTNNHMADLSCLMQQCNDKLLASIVPHIKSHELDVLELLFDMTIGWENVYDERVISDAIADGVESPGRNRFTGMVDTHGPGPWRGYKMPTFATD